MIINKKILLFLSFCIATPLFLKADGYQIRLLTGSEINTLAPFIAQLRIDYFREYPYLYEGNWSEEEAYLRWFSNLPDTAIAVAYSDQTPIGFLTGTGVNDFDEHFKGSANTLQKNGIDPNELYYLSECIILPAHRGHRLSDVMFTMLEAFAKTRGYKGCCFVTESHDEHPLKPLNYRPMDKHWQYLGYAKTSISITFAYPTKQVDGSTLKQEHAWYYWFKFFKEE